MATISASEQLHSRHEHLDTEQLAAFFQTPATIGAAETKKDLLESLSYAMRALFPGLLRIEIYLADERGNLVLSSRVGPPRSGMAVGSLGPLRARLLPDLYEDAHLAPACKGLLRGPAMCAPLLNSRVAIGFLVIEAAKGKGFTTVDLQVLEGVASVGSLAFQRIRTRLTDRARASFELDRRSATHVQRRLMNQLLPADSGVKVDAQYVPALGVGGDFYDVSCLADGRVGAAIGDVSGKGVSAALIMSRVSSEVRRALRSGLGPSKVLQEVNTSLSDIESDTFATATCIWLDPRRRTLTLANAGHIPLVVRRASGEVFDFGPASGTPLGVMPCEYADERLDLRPGDIILLMTDGLADALDCPSNRTGSRRLHRLVAAAPHEPAAINAVILAAANTASGNQLRDDVSVVALQLDP